MTLLINLANTALIFTQSQTKIEKMLSLLW